MVSEVNDVMVFLAAHPPFNHLEESQLALLSENTLTGFSRAGDELKLQGDDARPAPGVVVLRSGSMELRSLSGELLDRLSAGDYLVPDHHIVDDALGGSVYVLEDSLYYEVPSKVLDSLRAASPQLDQLFLDEKPHLRMASSSRKVSLDHTVDAVFPGTKVSDYMSPHIVFAEADTSILEAAKIMQQNGISSLLIKQGDELSGIITDRDFRNRVLSQGVSDSQPISSVMTTAPLYIAPEQPLSDAELTMMSENIRNLPVVSNGETVGMISLSDILRASNIEPLPLVHAFGRSSSVDDMERHSREIPELVARLIERDTRAVEVGKILTTFADAMTRRLIRLAQNELGEAPGAYAWMAFGSQARQEQVLGSDQDNALLLADDTADSDMAYYAALAAFVNEGLDRCGMPYCPGEVMAKNPKWCMRLGDWQAQFSNWIEQPSPDALMHASIFFDMRHIDGDANLTQTLHASVLRKAESNTIFHAMMNENAQQHTPPLGFFKTFVLETDGDHNQTLELKKRGTIPIVDIARNCALAAGIDAVNTLERLHALPQTGGMSFELAESLVDAHEFIAGIRLEAQASEIRHGRKPDNHLDPDALSPLVRHQLKDAFTVVREAQQAMTARFGGGAL